MSHVTRRGISQAMAKTTSPVTCLNAMGVHGWRGVLGRFGRFWGSFRWVLGEFWMGFRWVLSGVLDGL